MKTVYAFTWPSSYDYIVAQYYKQYGGYANRCNLDLRDYLKVLIEYQL